MTKGMVTDAFKAFDKVNQLSQYLCFMLINYHNTPA